MGMALVATMSSQNQLTPTMPTPSKKLKHISQSILKTCLIWTLLTPKYIKHRFANSVTLSFNQLSGEYEGIKTR